MQNLIRIVISTLNEVEVKGRDNLDKLLGSINALESVVQILENSAENKKTESQKEEANG